MAPRILLNIDDPDFGLEPFVASPGGIISLGDLNPGDDALDFNPRLAAPIADGIVFAASDGVNGEELWYSDGTADGTSLLADIFPGELSSDIGRMARIGDFVYFSAGNFDIGTQPFRTDGTVEGTIQLGQIQDLELTGAAKYVALGDLAIFRAEASATGIELYSSDGTPEGTGLLSDINEGSGDSTPEFGEYGEAGGFLYFSATDPGGIGRELYRTDGTPGGTGLVRDIELGEFGSSPSQFAALPDGRVLFEADDGSSDDELWVTDGTVGGTFEVRNINISDDSFPNGLTPVGDVVVFVADDGVSGREPWVSDGTPEGTFRLADINAGSPDGIGFFPFVQSSDGSRAYFSAFDPDIGSELWVTDGTMDGTAPLVDIVPGPDSSSPRDLVLAGDMLYFTATTPDFGEELWITDGTAEGTRIVEDFTPGPDGTSFIWGVAFDTEDDDPEPEPEPEPEPDNVVRDTDGDGIIEPTEAKNEIVDFENEDKTASGPVENFDGDRIIAWENATAGIAVFTMFSEPDSPLRDIFWEVITDPQFSESLNDAFGYLQIDYDNDGTIEAEIAVISDAEEIDFTLEVVGDDLRLSAVVDPEEPGQGTPGNDALTGTSSDERIEGGAGDDTVTAGAGDDSIIGGAGADSLLGEAGNDNIASGDGDDRADGGAGNDFIGGGLGNDVLEGGSGADTLGGGQGDDIVLAGDGDDVVAGGPGEDLIEGGAGNDVMGASFGDDTVRGGAGDDSLGGGTGRDLIRGGDGDDSVGGGEGDDTILGDAGDDFLAGGGRDDSIVGGAGDDRINGGDGEDTLSGLAGDDVFVWNAPDVGAVDVILDFTLGEDLIFLTGVENAPGSGLQGRFDALDIGFALFGGGVLSASITYEGQTILLQGVDADALSLDDFIFA